MNNLQTRQRLVSDGRFNQSLRCLVVVAFALSMGACSGKITSKDNKDSTRPDLGSVDMAADSSGDMVGDSSGDMTLPENDCGVTPVFKKLESSCATCHRGGNTPYFASVDSFYNLIVNNPKWVVPGNPQGSQLVALLRGSATGAYAQMPLGEDSFKDLEDSGKTAITIGEIETFITDIDGCKRGEAPAVVAPPVERKRARQIVNTLYQHLGLTKADVLPFNKSRNYNDSLYPIYNPDDTKPVTNDPHIKPSTQGPGIRWFAIGGGSRLYVTKSNRTFSPTFGQAMIQVSQAWCGFAVKKDNNQAIFKHVSQENPHEATDEQVRQNIKYLMLRFWGHVATEEDITMMKTKIYDAYMTPEMSSATNAKTAWQAVCASLVRDPMWLSY